MALNYTSDKLKHLKMFYDILNLFFFLVEICIIFWLSYPTPPINTSKQSLRFNFSATKPKICLPQKASSVRSWGNPLPPKALSVSSLAIKSGHRCRQVL